MLTIIVVENTAEARSRLIGRWSELLDQSGSSLGRGRIAFNGASFAELSLMKSPPVILLGPEMVAADLVSISRIRKVAPKATIIVVAPVTRADLASTEEFLRLGADDVIVADVSGIELQRKMTVILRRSTVRNPGKLVLVMGSKGGVGTTSLAAAIGDALLDAYDQVCLIDTDVRTQALTRFLRARPTVNEALQLILTEERPPTKEFLDQTVTPLGEVSGSLGCVAPIPDEERWLDPRSNIARTFNVYTENLAEQYDAMVIDGSGVRGALLRYLVRAADVILVVVGNDPAGMYTSLELLRRISPARSPSTIIGMIQNAPQPGGLTRRELKQEIERAVGTELISFWNEIPDSRTVRSWPGSGASPYGCGGKPFQKAIQSVVAHSSLTPEGGRIEKESRALRSSIGRVFGLLRRGLPAPEFSPKFQPALPLPESVFQNTEKPLVDAGRSGVSPQNTLELPAPVQSIIPAVEKATDEVLRMHETKSGLVHSNGVVAGNGGGIVHGSTTSGSSISGSGVSTGRTNSSSSVGENLQTPPVKVPMTPDRFIKKAKVLVK